MIQFIHRKAVYIVPAVCVASMIGLSLSSDVLATLALKALVGFSMLGCLAVAGRDGRTVYVEIGSKSSIAQKSQKR